MSEYELIGTCRIYGPMWQAECVACQDMMDVWDTREEAEDDARDHTCAYAVDKLLNVLERAGWAITELKPGGYSIRPPKERGREFLRGEFGLEGEGT